MVGMAGQRQEGQQHSNLLVATVSKLLHGLRGVEGRKSDLAQLHRRLFFGGLFFISTWGAQFFLCQSILRSFTNRSKLGRFFLSPHVATSGTAAFAADCLLQAHSTPLPRLFLVELTQYPGDDMIRAVQDTARIHKASLLH